jgi:heme exporter protein B
MLKSIRFILYIELILLWRRSHEWLYPLVFFMILILLFPLALTPDPDFLKKFFPGFLWIAALLASLLSMEHLFVTEMEDGHAEQLLLSQLPLPMLLLIKLIAQWLTTELPLILLTPLLGWIFHLSFTTISSLVISLLVGTPILTLIGSLGVTLTHGLRQQGVILGILILPLTIPVLIFGVSIIKQSDMNLPIAGPCAVLAGLSLFAISFLPFAMSTALRLGLDD